MSQLMEKTPNELIYIVLQLTEIKLTNTNSSFSTTAIASSAIHTGVRTFMQYLIVLKFKILITVK